MNKFLIVVNNGTIGGWAHQMWSDCLNQNNDFEAIYFESPVRIKSRLLKKIYKLHFSNKINNFVSLPFKNIWNKYSSIEQNLDTKDNNYIIFQSNVKISPSYVKYLKNKYKCKIILYLPDTIKKLIGLESKEKFLKYKRKNHIDCIYSFDLGDCEKYDIKYFDIYSRCSNVKIGNKFTATYVGSYRSKKRLDVLNYLSENLLNTCFYLFGIDKNEHVYVNSKIKTNEYIDYKKNLEISANSNCIVEIVEEGQRGNTLKAKEAFCYNKLLLTNNKEIIHSKLYNPDYVQIFENIDDIDLNWIKRKIDVDYKYDNSFSPYYLCIDIIERFSHQCE